MVTTWYQRHAHRLLLMVGFLQLAGSLVQVPMIRGLGAATAASPAPRVFTTVRGFEAFSSGFELRFTEHGVARRIPITPERYARVRGAYNRRNAYGAIVAGGPALVGNPTTGPMHQAVARFALCDEAPLLREIGVDPAAVDYPVTIAYSPRTPAPAELPMHISIGCAQ